MIHREIRIYMPNITDTTQVAALKDNKPFLMKAEIPVGSFFLGVTSIPSVIDMMGFSGGGGPPGYSYAVTNAQATEPHLFAAVLPNQEVPRLEVEPEHAHTMEWLGVAQAVGILFGHFKMTGAGVRDGTVEKLLTESGGLIIDMIQYEPPPMLRTLYDPKMQEAISQSVQEAMKDAQASKPK